VSTAPGRPGPPARVPTLTEVVVLPEPAEELEEAEPESDETQLDATQHDVSEAHAPAPADAPITEDQLVQRVLGDLQRQIDLMLEYRLREVLAPTVARAADALIRDARNELASTLHDMVTRAVAQELSRHRDR
jgi:hypothetical protein